LLEIDIENNALVLLDKQENDANRQGWIINPGKEDKKPSLSRIPYCYDENIGGICNGLYFQSYLGGNGGDDAHKNNSILISTVRTIETAEEQEDDMLKGQNAVKRLDLSNNIRFNDAVDSFISVVNIEENISRLYFADRLGYTQVKFFRFEKEQQGEIISNKIDNEGNLWTLLKAPLKTDIQDSQVSMEYFLVKNGDFN
jgi:hypothetical protein